MLNGEKLAIFDFFEIDTNLPKWKKPEKIGNDEKENDQDGWVKYQQCHQYHLIQIKL